MYVSWGLMCVSSPLSAFYRSIPPFINVDATLMKSHTHTQWCKRLKSSVSQGVLAEMLNCRVSDESLMCVWVAACSRDVTDPPPQRSEVTWLSHPPTPDLISPSVCSDHTLNRSLVHVKILVWFLSNRNDKKAVGIFLICCFYTCTTLFSWIP